MLLAQDAHPTLTTRAAAAALGLKPDTLKKMRLKQKGPPFFRINGAIRYDPTDIAAYLGRRRVAPANEVRA